MGSHSSCLYDCISYDHAYDTSCESYKLLKTMINLRFTGAESLRLHIYRVKVQSFGHVLMKRLLIVSSENGVNCVNSYLWFKGEDSAKGFYCNCCNLDHMIQIRRRALTKGLFCGVYITFMICTYNNAYIFTA